MLDRQPITQLKLWRVLPSRRTPQPNGAKKLAISSERIDRVVANKETRRSFLQSAEKHVDGRRSGYVVERTV